MTGPTHRRSAAGTRRSVSCVNRLRPGQLSDDRSGTCSRDIAPAHARRRLRPRAGHPRQPRFLARRCAERQPPSRPVQLLRLRSAGHEPPGAGRRSGLPGGARRGGAEQAVELGHLHGAAGRVRRDIQPGARRSGVAAPVPRRGRGARRGERAQDRVRLEAATQRVARTPGAARHPGAAPAPGLPRPQRLHPLAHQHRPAQDRAVPDVRLAADRRPGHPVPAGPAPRRGRGRRAARARSGASRVRRAPARHRLLHRRADPGRGRGQPHARGVPAGDAGPLP